MPLVFVPTPLGNLRDVTLRALDVLRDAQLLVAEDTRVARKLLHALGLEGREIWSYREQNAASVAPGILERARHALVAVTTDAGMPGISDPGSELIAAARAAGVAVEVLPGPSAALGVAVLSGFPLRRFSFEGFPPRSPSARRKAFERALRSGATSIWFESPQRIRATLEALESVAPAAATFLVREYTKLHEEQLAGTPGEIAARLADPVRGEIAFAVAAVEDSDRPQPPASTDEAIDALLSQGRRVGEIAKELARRGCGERRELYARATGRAKRAKGAGAPVPEPH
ncbi:MAG TPA: 16S rRNA (cytidine(1402)-2'-O)-methyltransferase [Candidatus Baltobacteraceae bacterium]|nr:16S rRNA (cytidine(1402)-2'-O)-methyltransferase [Candidatus Baltobacteraceae bacterium]